MTNPVHHERQGPRFRWPVWTWRWGLEVLFLLGLVPVVAIAVLVLAGVDNRVVDLLAQFIAPALFATVLLTGGLGLLRMKAAASLGLLASAVLALTVWPQWFPKASAPEPNAPVVRLYSANLFYLNNDTAMIRR